MVNCALMNTDWRSLSLYQYEALTTVWNQRHDPDYKPEADLTDLQKFVGAHSGRD